MTPGGLFGEGKDASEAAAEAGGQSEIDCPECGVPQGNLPEHLKNGCDG